MRFFSCPSRDSGSRRAGQGAVAVTRPALVRSPPPAEFFCPTSSTLLASGAPPTPFGTASGYSSIGPDSQNQGPVRSSPGVRLLFRALRVALRPSSPSPDQPACASRTVPGNSGPPLLGFLLPRTPLRRVPLSPVQPLPATREDEVLPRPRRCRPQGSRPSRRFWLRSRDSTDPCGVRRFLVTPPTLRGLIPCRSRPYGAALQSFPFPRSRTRSRGPFVAPLRVRNRPPPRNEAGSFATAFPGATALCPATRPEANRRRRSRDDGFPRSLGRPRRRTRECASYDRPFPSRRLLAW